MSLSAFASEGAAAGGGGMTHKMTMLAIQMGVILFAARFGGMLAEKIKLPAVLGELASGILMAVRAGAGIAMGSFPARVPAVEGAAVP